MSSNEKNKLKHLFSSGFEIENFELGYVIPLKFMYELGDGVLCNFIH